MYSMEYEPQLIKLSLFRSSKSKASMDMYNLVKLSERYSLVMLDVSETSILWLLLIC